MTSGTFLRNERAELRRALEQALSSRLPGRRRALRFRRRLSSYSSSCPLENVHVELHGGASLRLVLKDLSPASLLPTARDVRPHFLYDSRREVETYRKLLDPERLGTPVFYGSFDSKESGHCWLFLERVEGPLLWQLGRMEYWQDAATWLARFHSDFDEPRDRNGESLGHSPERLSHLLRHDEHFYTFWLAQAERFLRNGRVQSSPEIRRRFGRIAAAYDRVVARLLAMPRTLIHGEFYPSNIIVRSNERPRRICPVDWEVAAIAPGLIDLGALTSGKWTIEQQTAMVAAYRSALDHVDGSRPSVPELLEGVHYCQLHLSMQWLGWAADWSPPAQHAHNWLREACRLGERLGL